MLVLVCFLYFQYICACYSYINKFMCIRICVCVCVAYLQACIAIDSENKIKQQSPHHTHTDTLTLTQTSPLSHSPAFALSLSLSLTLSHSSTMKAIELNHCRWQFSAICLQGWGRALQQATRRDVGFDAAAHNKLQRDATHGRAARRSAAQLLLAAAALSHFAFHILTQRTRLCPPPRAAFAVDFQCEMKSRG